MVSMCVAFTCDVNETNIFLLHYIYFISFIFVFQSSSYFECTWFITYNVFLVNVWFIFYLVYFRWNFVWHVVHMWSICGPYVVHMWSICGSGCLDGVAVTGVIVVAVDGCRPIEVDFACGGGRMSKFHASSRVGGGCLLRHRCCHQKV